MEKFGRDPPNRPTGYATTQVHGFASWPARLQVALPSTDLNAMMRKSPEGEVPLHRALTFPVCDVVVHTWDVYRSQDQLVELPEDLLTFCRELVESLSNTCCGGQVGTALPNMCPRARRRLPGSWLVSGARLIRPKSGFPVLDHFQFDASP